MLTEVFKDLISFLRNPKEVSDAGKSGLFKIKVVAILYLIELPVILVFFALVSILVHFNLLDVGVNKVSELLDELSYLQMILLIVLAAPFLEEIIFRLPLKYKRNYLLRLVVFFVSMTGLFKKERLNEYVLKSWNVSFKYFFYLLALVFGFIHLTNFENSKELILFMPLLTLTQTTAGLIMGFIRVKYGFIWGYFYHAFNNFVFVSLAFLSLNSDFAYHFDKDGVSINIEKCDRLVSKGRGILVSTKSTGYAKIKSDTIEFNRYRIKDVVSDLLMMQGKYVISNELESGSYYNITSAYAIHDNKAASTRGILMSHLNIAFGINLEKSILKKEAWELYLMDSTKFNNDSAKAEFMQVNGNMRSIGRYMDRKYGKEFIFSIDTIHHTLLNVPLDITFDNLREYLRKEYGIGSRRVSREIEFTCIKEK